MIRKPIKLEDYPRRQRVDLLTPAEKKIREAQIAVEELSTKGSVPHPLLLDVIGLLRLVREKMADYVDGEIAKGKK